MAKKFIPEADDAFQTMASNFCNAIARDPDGYFISREESSAMMDALQAFNAAKHANFDPLRKSRLTRMTKDDAREKLERLIRDAANRIRINREIEPAAKHMINVIERPTRLRKRECPQTPPKLRFVGPTPFTWTADGVHTIAFRDPFGNESTNAKPDGADGIELYYDLLLPNEPIPKAPTTQWGGTTRYLRRFTRSPITVECMLTDQPMRVVYWAKWTNAAGDTGRFSGPLPTRLAGLDPIVPGPMRIPDARDRRKQTVIVTSGHKQLTGTVEGDEIETVEIPPRLLGDERGEAA